MKSLSCIILTIWHSEKDKITETIKELVVVRVSRREEEGWIDGALGIYRAVKLIFMILSVQFSSVTQVVSDSLRLHKLQHTRPPGLSPAPGVYPNSSPLSQWCHPTISSSVIPFCSHLQSFPASGSFQMSQFFTSGGQRIGVSASASVLPMNSQDDFL